MDAVALYPNIYGKENRDINGDNDEEEEDHFEEDREAYDDLNYDLYNLTAADFHSIPLLPSPNHEELEKQLHNLTQRTTQMLIRKVFECPTEKSEVGPLALLPEEISRLPREKRIPEPKPETKWEKFAKEKGITNKKKEKMVFDETTGAYAPRYGYQRVKKGIEDHAIVEVKPGTDPNADPWEAVKEEKKSKLKKNLKSQRQNINRALKAKGKGNSSAGIVTEYEPTKVPGIPIEMTSSSTGKYIHTSSSFLPYSSSSSSSSFYCSSSFVLLYLIKYFSNLYFSNWKGRK